MLQHIGVITSVKGVAVTQHKLGNSIKIVTREALRIPPGEASKQKEMCKKQQIAAKNSA
ncbi:hypothetical protein [Janthinobacterium sp.]|uniref:hypothetical protein n=1 Tax=Janthinobacterium sp. TaxID=1871054 RepID=UPI00293D4B4E|nr:hypothetical protein [Janthinobacterium sp.]